MPASTKSTILFITTANLTANPRLYKELQLAVSKGYHPVVIAIDARDWSNHLEPALRKGIENVTIHYIDATRHNFVPWLVASLLNTILLKLFPFITLKLPLQSFAINKRSFLIYWYLQKLTVHPQLIVAHNLGAFYPAYFFAQKKNIPFGIDVEDFHPGEASNLSIKKLVADHMYSIFRKAAYISFASPLIKEKTENEIPIPDTCINVTINNVFSEKEFSTVPVLPENTKMKLVWFSQNIDFGRGLEKMLKIFDFFEKDIELTLIGNLRNSFYVQQIEDRKYIEIRKPMLQKDLHLSLSAFDIGLALEDCREDENRNICLTNKIWAYLQAGLTILASDTLAQVNFAATYSNQVMILSSEETIIKNTLHALLLQKEKIRQNKQHFFLDARKVSWENESKKLEQIWRAFL